MAGMSEDVYSHRRLKQSVVAPDTTPILLWELPSDGYKGVRVFTNILNDPAGSATCTIRIDAVAEGVGAESGGMPTDANVNLLTSAALDGALATPNMLTVYPMAPATANVSAPHHIGNKIRCYLVPSAAATFSVVQNVQFLP